MLRNLSREFLLNNSTMPLHFATLLFALHCLTACNAIVCHRISDSKVQVDAGIGQVFMVDTKGRIYTRFGHGLPQVPGTMKHVTVGPAGIWAVNSANQIFKYVLTHWVQVPGEMHQIDAGGDQFVSGASHQSSLCLPMVKTVGYTEAYSPVEWVSFGSSLKYYSCGPYSCWAVNKEDEVFVRRGVNSTDCQGSEWQPIPGSFSMIEVGGDGSVYGLGSDRSIFRRDSTSPCNPDGTGWTHIPVYRHQVKHVSYDSGHLFIILTNNHIYDCKV